MNPEKVCLVRPLKDNLSQLLVRLGNLRLFASGENTAALVQLLLNPAVAFLNHVLLVHNLVNVAVAQCLPPAAHVLAYHDRVNVGLISRNPRRHRNRHRLSLVGVPEFVHHQAVLTNPFGIFLGLRHHGNHAVSRLNVLVKLHLVAVVVLRPFVAAVSASVQACHIRPAFRAALHLSRLVVLQILQLHVIHPCVTPNAALVISEISEIDGHNVLRRASAASALGVALCLVRHAYAVFLFYMLLRHAHLHDDKVHVVDFVHPVLENHLSGVQQAHAKLPSGLVGVSVAVPFHKEDVSPLYGCDALVHVVQHLKGQAVCLVPQEILQCFRQLLMLLPPCRHLRHGKAAVHLCLHQLRNDVSHAACLCCRLAALCVRCFLNLARPVVKCRSLVHLLKFFSHRRTVPA